MTLSFEWVFGIFYSILSAVILALFIRQGALDKRIDEVIEKFEARVKEVNGVIDQMKDSYIRRLDADMSIARVEKALSKVEGDVGDLGVLLRDVLIEMGRKPTPRTRPKA